jgi:tight adherence protein B
MRGRPLRTALAAAQTFLSNVPSDMPVGVVTFAGTVDVASPVSSERGPASAAVASIGSSTSRGTAMYDAVVTATHMFDAEDDAQHNVILVTDGRNTTGQADADAALEAADAAGVHLFTIGLSGPTTDEIGLRALAAQTGGSYAAISPADLDNVYAGIADRLVQQQVVRYRSKAPYGAVIDITVATPEGEAATGFVAPGIGSAPTDVPTRSQGPVSTPWAMGGIAFLTFVSVVAAALLVVSARDRRRRAAQLRSRIEEPPEESWDVASAITPSSPSVMPKQIAELAERGVGADRRRSIAKRLNQAGWSMRPGDFVGLVVLAVVVAGGLCAYLVRPLLAVPAAIVGGLVPWSVLSAAATRRLARIQAQLADTLLIIAGAMRAGHSFLQALDTAAKEIDDPAASEFGLVLAEIRFGRDVDDALDALVERVGSTDLEWTVTAIKIQRQVGGNLAEVLETVAGTIRERETLRRQVKVLSAEGRLSMVVLFVLPFAIAGYLMVTNPTYLKLLTNTRPGMIILCGAFVLLGVGFVWMKRIVRLDV